MAEFLNTYGAVWLVATLALTLYVVIAYGILRAFTRPARDVRKRHYRFSLRTLLIIATLIALVLGLFAWLRPVG